MPLYEYQCNTCGKDFERIVRFSEADLTPCCPSCGYQDTSKKISAAASFGSSSAGPSISSSSSCAPGGRFT
ncbi:MAG: zinc ribbon domain-containing protein [Pelolinea sp.]|nr:zinc ribbon domain-containing protein [Pelolinea sp.]